MFALEISLYESPIFVDVACIQLEGQTFFGHLNSTLLVDKRSGPCPKYLDRVYSNDRVAKILENDLSIIVLVFTMVTNFNNDLRKAILFEKCHMP